jgi:hypothetical protein
MARDAAVDDAVVRILRLEKVILELAAHVGATGWNPPLQKLLDEIQADLRRVA